MNPAHKIETLSRFLKTRLTILFAFLTYLLSAQQVADTVPFNKVQDINPRFIKIRDSLYLTSGICKSLRIWKPVQNNLLTSANSVKSAISIKGNIQYDFLYRSFADTPFFQNDFRQHTIRTHLEIAYKENYPVQVNLVIRKSNSPYFRDFFDGGLAFDRLGLQNRMKENLLARIADILPEKELLSADLTQLAALIQQKEKLKNRLKSNLLAQELIEERERLYIQAHHATTINMNAVGHADTGAGNISQKVAQRKSELDSVEKKIYQVKVRVDSLDKRLRGKLAEVQRRMSAARNMKEINGISREQGLEEKRDKWKAFVSDIRTFGIGRNVLNFSELTVKDVSVTGFSIEYNPKMYFALAAGKADYGFRDFFGRNTNNNKQHVFVGRIGFGNIERKALIFSAFTGRKALYSSLLSDTVTGNYPVLGYSLEGIIKKDHQNFISAELAKSAYPVTGRFITNEGSSGLFRFSDKRNLGVSINGQTVLTSTNTRIKGFFRKTGEYYQSFSLFNYNTDLTAWMIRAEQPFLKKRLTITGSLRKNDFINPFTEKTFKTSTLFGSGHLSLRIPKWPVLTFGYQPGSQIYIIDRTRARENVYYMLNAAAVHQYKFLNTRMVSSIMYNSYQSKGVDSGFINYDGRYYMLTQAVLFNALQLQGNYIYTDQPDMQFSTLDVNVEAGIGKVFQIGAGLKFNKIVSGNSYWGSTGQLSVNLKRLGNLQVQYDKSYLPTITQKLFPVEMGRVTFYKYF